VHDLLHTDQRLRDGVTVGHVPDVQLRLGGNELRAAITVHLFHKFVEDPHLVSLPEQVIDHVRADEAGTAGYKHTHVVLLFGGVVELSQTRGRPRVCTAQPADRQR